MSKQYLYKISILNKKNSNPLEASSYYSGENQFDMTNNKSYTSNTVETVVWNSLIVPTKMENENQFDHLPEYLRFRSQKRDVLSNARNILWQNVYTRESRDDAQFARLFEVAVPSFLNQKVAIETIEKFAKILVNEGMIIDSAIHARNKHIGQSLIEKIKSNHEEEKEQVEFHDYKGFLMCTLRDYKDGMFVNKNREWNSKSKMESWRRSWVEILTETINLHHTNIDTKSDWEKKLSIYDEYAEIKQNYSNSKQSLRVG